MEQDSIDQVNRKMERIEKETQKIFYQLLSGQMNDPIGDIRLSYQQKNKQIQELNSRLGEQEWHERRDLRETQIQRSEDIENRKKRVEEYKKEVRTIQMAQQHKLKQFMVFVIRNVIELKKDSAPPQYYEVMLEKYERSLQPNYEDQRDQGKWKYGELKEKLQKYQGKEKFERLCVQLQYGQEWDQYQKQIEQETRVEERLNSMRNQMKQCLKQEGQRVKRLFRILKKSLFFLKVSANDHKTFNSIENYYKQRVLKQKRREKEKEKEKLEKGQVKRAEVKQLVEGIVNLFYNKLDEFINSHNRGKVVDIRAQRFQLKEAMELAIDEGSWERVLEGVSKQVDDKFYYIERRTKFFTHQTKLINDLIKV